MILAAGRGARLRPLTDKIPKPLVKVGSYTLIEHHINKLADAGFESVVINTSHLGDKIHSYLGNGDKFNIPIHYSDEGDDALETAGGIAYALPLIGKHPFLVISSDIYSDFPFDAHFKLNQSNMHLIMINNPPHHATGDFTAKQINLSESQQRYTYSGIAYINPKLFTHEKRAYPLIDTIHQCINENTISAELYSGTWFDVGTVGRLHEANKAALKKIS